MLVTFDIKHFAQTEVLQIITPQQFIEAYISK